MKKVYTRKRNVNGEWLECLGIASLDKYKLSGEIDMWGTKPKIFGEILLSITKSPISKYVPFKNIWTNMYLLRIYEQKQNKSSVKNKIKI